MKSTLKVCIWVALIVSVTFSNAGVNDSLIEVNVTGEKTFSLTLSGQPNNVQAVLKNKKGHVLEQRMFRDGISTISFDLNETKEGIYRLELIDSEEVLTLPVELLANEVKVSLEDKESYLFPVVYQKGNLVTVSKWAPESEVISVSILDGNHSLIHEDRIEGDQNLAKRFDFSKVRSGNYEIRLSCKDQTVTRSVDIK